MVRLVFQNRNIIGNLYGFVFSNEFLALLPKTQATKEKFDELDLSKLKTLVYQTKDIIKKVQRLSKEWKKNSQITNKSECISI